MKLTILGCHSASPRINANPTSQILEIRNHIFLIDCGEGTQVQLRKYKVKFSRIKHIFISHLHGDHYFGLVGLISTFRLLTREADLHIYAPKGLKEVITMQMKLADSWTNFKLIFHELSSKTSELIFEDDKVEVKTIPLDHRVYTNGFLFIEKAYDRKLDISKALNAKVDKAYFDKLKQGFDVKNELGVVIKNADVTLPGQKPKRYAFCSDTIYNESIVPMINKVDALYHESTFLEEHSKLAAPTKHSTAKQAAAIAEMAQVKTLILGHYSSRYRNLDAFMEEAKLVFKEKIELAEAGKEIVI
jgi:ribonuclease Z